MALGATCACRFDEEGKNLLRDERQQQCNDNLWNAMLYEVQQIQVPAVFERGEGVFLLWKCRREESSSMAKSGLLRRIRDSSQA